MKLGAIVFSSHSGLGNQTRRLAYMLNPDRLLVIDSSNFSKNKKQNFDWYSSFSGYKVKGFPSNRDISVFIRGLTHIIVCENPLNFSLLDQCKANGIKLYIQSNYEFCDHLNKKLTPPHKFLMPSYWKVDTMRNLFGHDTVEYLPPPIDPNDFKKAREENLSRSGKRRFLHIVGTLAAEDRNGTLDLLKSLNHSRENFELVIRSQHQLPSKYHTSDNRVKFIFDDEPDIEKMYKDFDALILPRRYGGLSLTTNEALMSGLPVIMPDISPNNQLLPKKWLVRTESKHQFFTRTMIDVYKTSPVSLGQKLDYTCQLSDEEIENMKLQAFEIAYNEFSPTVLKPKYDQLWTQ